MRCPQCGYICPESSDRCPSCEESLLYKPASEEPLEADIEDEFVRYAEVRYCEAKKLRIDGEDGFPDRTVLTPSGGIFFVEFKRNKREKLRPQQRRWKKILEAKGFRVLVTHELDVAKAELDSFLSGRKTDARS